MIFRITIGIFCLCAFLQATAQEASISGVVTDSLTGDVLPGTTVWLEENQKGTICDAYGFFILHIPKGDYTLHCHHLGYQSRIIRMAVTGDQQVFPSLHPQEFRIRPAEITAQTSQLELKSTRPGQIRLSAAGLERVPALMAESDPLSALRYLPGVQSVAEADGYLYVRGGSADQNLVLLDDGVIYNPAHLFGVFSVVNPSVIRSVDLYKSAIPATYGNRLSSVVDIKTRAPDLKHTGGSVTTGIMLSKFLVETPIVSDQVGVLIAARRSQLDWLSRPFLNKTAFKGSGYFFGDLNVRMNWNISPRSKLWATWYSGTDRGAFFDRDFAVSAGMKWGNRLFGVTHWYRLNAKNILISSFHFSGYQMELDFFQHPYAVDFETGIRSGKLKTEWHHYRTDNQRWIAGISLEGKQFSPYQVHFDINGSPRTVGYSQGVRTSQATAFVNYSLHLLHRWRLEAGLRAPAYFHHGPYIQYLPGVTGQQAMDSILFERNELVYAQVILEPRLTLAFDLSPQTTLKAAFSQHSQSIHMVPVSTATLPADIWTPATSRTPPQKGTNWSLGIFNAFPGHGWEVHLEGYYRTMAHQVAFKEGLSTLDLVKYNLDMHLAVGSGKAYGIEWMVRKKHGRISGWLGYTWSVTRRQFAEINDGKPFFPKHDRRHDLNLMIHWQATERADLTLNYVYATGQAISLPGSFYYFDGKIVNHYAERNNFRMPAYHRLDFSAKILPAKKRKVQSAWTFSIYNVYNQMNPFFIYFDSNWMDEDGKFGTQARKIALLPIIPAISWTGTF